MLQFQNSILVVDDDKSVAEFIRVVLAPSGCRLEFAHDLESGLRALAAKPTVVIADLRLQEESGIPIIACAASLIPRPGIVAISGSGVEALDEAASVGADRTLDKPFSPGLLCDVVDELISIRLSGGIPGLRQGDVPPSKPVRRPPHLDSSTVSRVPRARAN